ncbi:MAG: FadR family transcriptional regulator [Bacteroidales bacterium]|nr:FadR family transcriptional regulator [Bacteroidales bacterium]
MAKKRTSEDELRVVPEYVKHLLESGQCGPGQRLPAERKMAEELGISRPKVRLALEKLEFYGVLNILPQSGSVLANHSRAVLIRQISNLLEESCFDFASLVSVRTMLETKAIRLCAELRTEAEIVAIEAAHRDFVDNANGSRREEKDFAFHAAIAKASHNPVLYSLYLIVAPDVLAYYKQLNACSAPLDKVIEEHKAMLECIKAGDADAAEKELLNHFTDITEFASNISASVPRNRI